MTFVYCRKVLVDVYISFFGLALICDLQIHVLFWTENHNGVFLIRLDDALAAKLFKGTPEL